MKVLNLYAGIGGNRKNWVNCDVTAVENNNEIAGVYKEKYPNDNVVVHDAHKYLEENYTNYDIIWSSPPCQSHGQYRHNVGVIGKGFNPIMPDMNLYSEIVFLKTYYKGLWVVENTVPYYTPLVEPSFKLQRHLFWSNVHVNNRSFKCSEIRSKNKISDFDGYEIVAKSKIKNKRQVLRNCLLPELGEYIFNTLAERLKYSDKKTKLALKNN